MSYIKPTAVQSPKNKWRLTRILHDSGEGEWAVAEGQWDHEGRWSDVLAIRWNGYEGAPIGNPQSRGLATWFIVPDELEPVIREKVAALTEQKEAS